MFTSSARLWPVVAAIFFLGLVVRVLLLSLTPYSPVPRNIEPINLAISLVQHGSYADPYSGESGPSAHCSPFHPLLAAFIIRLFGLGPMGSRALGFVAAAAASLGYALLPVLARRCSLSDWVGIAGGLTGAALPVNFWPQTSGVFEAPYTLLAFTVLACAVARDWCSSQFTTSGGVKSGIAGAAAALVSPGTIPILGVWFISGLFCFRKARMPLLRYFALITLIVFLALLPWALRNKASLGSTIFTRSNFGLEFQLSNNAVATSDNEVNVRNPLWSKLHPNTNPEQREKVRRMGEVAYNKAKLREALGWIRSNPLRFFQLTLGRIALFWFPRMLRFPQTVVEVMITILAIAGLVRLWKTRPDLAVFFGGASVAYSLVYLVIEVSPRYRFPIEGFLLLLGCYYLYSKFVERQIWNAFVRGNTDELVEPT